MIPFKKYFEAHSVGIDDITTDKPKVDWSNMGKMSPEDALAQLRAGYSDKEGRQAAKDRVRTAKEVKPSYVLPDKDVVSVKAQKALPYKAPDTDLSPAKALKSVDSKALKKLPAVGTALGLATAQNKLDAASAVDPTPISTGLETSGAAASAVTNLNKFRMGRLRGPGFMRDYPRSRAVDPRAKKFFK